MKDLDFRKKLLINEFKTLSKGRKKEEIIPLIMAVSTKARQSGIVFTKEDLMLIIDQTKDQLTEQEKKLLPELLEMLDKKNK